MQKRSFERSRLLFESAGHIIPGSVHVGGTPLLPPGEAPIYLCGVFGLKPTHGRVPSYPPLPFALISDVGPLTRTMRDAALMMTVMADPARNVRVPAQLRINQWRPMDRKPHHYLTVRHRIGDLLRHPAFEGFARLLLPWDNQKYDDDLPLSDIGTLLPYHSHVDPQVVVSALNRMIGNIDAGREVFHEFYTKAEKGEVPDRANAGLFFYPGEPGAPFAVIAPGGGFRYVASVHEGFPYAARIADSGYNAFVLKYRHGHHGTPAIEDLAAAIAYIFRHAETLGVGTHAYSLWGSSAGATMAAAIGADGPPAGFDKEQRRPSALIMAYGEHQDLRSSGPPTFVALGEHDQVSLPAEMEGRIAALTRQGATIEYRKYPGLGHGFGLGTGTSAEGWIADAIAFWEKAMRAHGKRTG